MSSVISFSNAEVNLGESYNTDIMLVVEPTRDSDGNELQQFQREVISVAMDNYQAYKLAMAILSKIDVEDTRGSR